MEKQKSHRSFGGEVEFWQHDSKATGTPMEFSVYLPSASRSKKVPVVYWLSGLTCTANNFTEKSGYQRYAEELGLCVVAPDTSPRGAGIDGEDDHWDFGTGAGFYVDATETPWSKHYNMYSYVAHELPKLIAERFPVDANRQAISGHSMGGHGALVVGLRNSDLYRSISAFAPICAPTKCPWGEKAFGNYLGSDRQSWEAYDAHILLGKADRRLPILVDQGMADNFLTEQLQPELLESAARKADYPVELRRQDGYDHSYFFISSFIGDHLQFHAEHLQA